MTAIETIADLFATRANGLSTGLPQLDRVAPLGPGHLAVLIGTSGVGKTPVARHIARTVSCTHERGVLTVSTPTSIDALDASLAAHHPALVVIDPLTALTSAEELVSPTQSSALDAPLSAGPFGDPRRVAEPSDHTEQRPVHPAELGRVATRLRTLALRHHVPFLVCHRYTPIRDVVTGQIVSTEAANPMLDQADVVAVVRVLADPQQVGLELLRNRLGPLINLRVPLPDLDIEQRGSRNEEPVATRDGEAAVDATLAFVPQQRPPSPAS